MDRITPQDIQEGVESVSASPESTWYKVVETLDNGDKLCLAIGMGEGFDEDTVCAKLGVLVGNSGMSDYVWDFQMPWNLGEGGNDVWDTEVSNPGESDAEWFNSQAEEMIRGFEDGTIGTSLVGSSRKAGKKRPVTSGNLSMKERAANREFEEQQKEWYSKPGTERAQIHHDDNIYTKKTNFEADLDTYHMTNIPGNVGAEYLTYDLQLPEDDRGVLLRLHDFEDISGSVTENGDTDLDDTWRTMFTIFANMLCRKKWNGKNLVAVQEGDEIWIDSPTIDFAKWSPEELESYAYFLHDCIEDLAPKVWEQLAHKKSLQSSRKPIRSMYVTEDISGNDLYTVLWSGGKDQFNSMVDDGADPDDILNACEELLFREEGNPPTLTELNDLIWFEPDTIREYIGLSNPIESGCHGKSKKKGKKKAVKSAMQISEIHNNTSNLYARVVYCDLDSDVTEFNEEELIPIYDFKEQLRNYAESMNGWYTVKHRDDGYEPGEYYVTFTNGESEGNDPDSPDYDPYLENELGSLKFELVCDAGDELCNYLESDRM